MHYNVGWWDKRKREKTINKTEFMPGVMSKLSFAKCSVYGSHIVRAWLSATAVHIPCGARPVRRRLLPVRHFRSVLGAVAGAALQLPVRPAYVRRTASRDADSVFAHLRHNREKVARLPAR